MAGRFVSFIAAFATATSIPAHAQSLSAPLLERNQQLVAAVKAKDAAKLAACYAEDAVWMQPNGPRLKGQKAIEERSLT